MAIHMSPTRAFKFNKNPLRALEDYQGKIDWWEGDDTALLFGTIVHNLAEGREATDGFTDDEKDKMISTRGKTAGQLKATFKDAEIIGQKLHQYVSLIDHKNVQFEVAFEETDEVIINEQPFSFNLTGRADMVTTNSIYDFKTVGAIDFDGFLKYGSFRDGREFEYMMQVVLYAIIFKKDEAHILYIKKNKETPFIYDYKLSVADFAKATDDIDDLITEAVGIVAGVKPAKAINDGSKWAYEHFGGIINDNQTISI